MGEVDVQVLSNHQITMILQEVEKMLKPLAEAQKMLEGEKYVTVSFIAVWLKKILKTLEYYCDTNGEHGVTESTKHLAKILYNNFVNCRYGSIMERMFYNPVQKGRMNRYTSLHPMHLAATVLDPRMKNVPNGVERDEIWDYVKVLFVVSHTMNVNSTSSATRSWRSSSSSTTGR